MRIRIQFFFYPGADPDPDPGSQTSADPCESGSGSRSEFLHEKFTVGNRSNIYESIFEGQETRFICEFWSIFLLLNSDPNPRS
jgi:hypothetical protein